MNFDTVAQSLPAGSDAETGNERSVLIARLFPCEPDLMITGPLRRISIQREVGDDRAERDFAPGSNVRNRAENQMATPHFHFVPFVRACKFLCVVGPGLVSNQEISNEPEEEGEEQSRRAAG